MNPQVLEAFREDGKRLRSLRDRKSTRLNSSHSQISYAVSFDRKSTRLNSSHSQISYAVFCLKKNSKRLIPAANLPPAAELGKAHTLSDECAGQLAHVFQDIAV